MLTHFTLTLLILFLNYVDYFGNFSLIFLSNKFNKKGDDLPLELCASCLSGLGAKSDPIPDEPRDEITPCLVVIGLSPPTIHVLRHLLEETKKHIFLLSLPKSIHR